VLADTCKRGAGLHFWSGDRKSPGSAHLFACAAVKRFKCGIPPLRRQKRSRNVRGIIDWHYYRIRLYGCRSVIRHLAEKTIVSHRQSCASPTNQFRQAHEYGRCAWAYRKIPVPSAFTVFTGRAHVNHYCAAAIESQALVLIASIKLTVHSASICLEINRPAQFLGIFVFLNLDALSWLSAE